MHGAGGCRLARPSGEFEEHSSGAGWVEKGYRPATGPAPGSLTDGSQPGRLATLERCLYVLYLESYVVQAGAALCQEASHGRIGGGRLEEFQPGVTKVEEGDPHLLRLDDLAARSGPPQDRVVDGHRGIEIRYGDRYVLETCL